MQKLIIRNPREEEVFRNILSDMRNNRDKRPAGEHIPSDLDSQSELDAILDKYCADIRYKVFTIMLFKIDEDDTALIYFQKVNEKSGGGAALRYMINTDDSVEYLHHESLMRV